MSPPGLRASLSLLLLLLLLAGCLLVAARRDKGAAGGPALGSSGRFVSPEQHACSWQLQQPASGARRAHYWKQVLGALRKKPRPCQDAAPLRARLCAGKKGHGAELRLVAGASPPAGPTVAGSAGEPRPRARSRGRPRDPARGPAAGVPSSPSAPSKEKPSEKKSKAGKKKVVSGPRDERPTGTGPDPDGLSENAELTETYCAEKWHSLCNFFVNFWNG